MTIVGEGSAKKILDNAVTGAEGSETDLDRSGDADILPEERHVKGLRNLGLDVAGNPGDELLTADPLLKV